MDNRYKTLFEPVSIGKLRLKNRFAMAPMGPLGLADAEGGFNQRGIDYYTRRAQGGTGLIITGVTFVDNEVEEHGMPNCPCSTHNPVQFVRSAKEMNERIHAYGAKSFLQMSGGFGRVTIPTNLGEFPPVAPSPIQHRWLDKTCRELTVGEIRHIVKKFGAPKSFIKDWRTGALPGDEFEEKGRDIPEGTEAAKQLASYGYDALDVDVGSYDAWWWSHPPMY